MEGTTPGAQLQEVKNAQKPTIGRIVIYNTTEADRDWMKSSGHNVSKQLPAIVVSVLEDYHENADGKCNIKVFVDGSAFDLWKPSMCGDNDGQWNWPVIKK